MKDDSTIFSLMIFFSIYYKNKNSIRFDNSTLDFMAHRFCSLHRCYTEYFPKETRDTINSSIGSTFSLEIENQSRKDYNFITMSGRFLSYVFGCFTKLGYDVDCLPYIVYRNGTRVPVSDEKLRENGKWITPPLFSIRRDSH